MWPKPIITTHTYRRSSITTAVTSLRCRRLVPDTTANAADPLPASCCRTTSNAVVPPPRRLPLHVVASVALICKAIVDNLERRRMVEGDGRHGRGRCLAEEDDDEYKSRFEWLPGDVIAGFEHQQVKQDKIRENISSAGAECTAHESTDLATLTHCRLRRRRQRRRQRR